MSRYSHLQAGGRAFAGLGDLIAALERGAAHGPARVQVAAVVADDQVGAGALTWVGTAVRDEAGEVTFEDLEPAEGE